MKLHALYQGKLLGTLADDRSGKIYFEYDSDFLAHGINLSPLLLPFKNGVQHCDHPDFKGLFGLFYDSLPDQWGMGLLEERLRRKGVRQWNALTCLGYLGSRGMGAITYQPSEELSESYHPINLTEVNREALQIVRGNLHEGIHDDLLKAGTSPGGARPKIIIGIHDQKPEFVSGNGPLPEGFSSWILKLQDGDKTSNGALEFLYHQIAHEAGIRTSPARLIPLPRQKKNVLFATQRFDRKLQNRVHYHSLCGIGHFPVSGSTDYDDFLSVTRELTQNHQEVEEAFSRATFNLIGCVRDDHVKNHGFLLEGNKWNLSPAFDLLPAKWNGIHSLGYLGEHRSPDLRSLEKLALYHSIRKDRSREIIQKTIAAFSKFKKIAKKFSLPDETIENFKQNLQEHFQKIGLK
ncbi:MAG: type II toxin-antitoxin system HipA family toxin [Verrucomicrobiota bacterium]